MELSGKEPPGMKEARRRGESLVEEVVMEKYKNIKSNTITMVKLLLIVIFYAGTVALLLSEVATATMGGA